MKVHFNFLINIFSLPDLQAFAYTYHSGAEQLTKQVVLRLNTEHRLEMLQEQVVASGFSPFVSLGPKVTIRDRIFLGDPQLTHRLIPREVVFSAEMSLAV